MAIDADRVHRTIRKLRKLLADPEARPSAEHVHDIRTRTRRLESAMEALGLDGGRLDAHLRRLRKRAGKVRDMDVLTAHAATVSVSGEGACLVELLQYLGAERYRHARRLRAFVRRDGSTLRRLLKRADRRIARCLPDDGDSDSARTRTMATALTLSRDLAAPTTLTHATLHPYRLKVKELRYVLEMSGDVDRNELVAQLGEVKDAIGEWHDWETLATIASEQLTHGARCPLLHEIRTTVSREYDRALGLTNRMRTTALQVRRRRGPAKVAARKRLPMPVLEATAAIAS
jgi:CHAD domain-containing protein